MVYFGWRLLIVCGSMLAVFYGLLKNLLLIGLLLLLFLLVSLFNLLDLSVSYIENFLR